LTADWEALPRGPWNYALDVRKISETRSTKTSESVFTLDGAPVRIQVAARRIPQWQDEGGYAGALQRSPVSSSEHTELLTLVPYGAAKLRITAFPELART
jgi:uncharacterized protein